MRARNVLIVGTADDAHVVAVAQALEEIGARAVILEDDHPRASIGYRVGSQTLRLRPGGAEEFEAASFEAVWWRRKGVRRRVRGAAFADREWQHALEPLAELLHDARWVNPHAAEFRMAYKPSQLHLATSCGLRIPPTLISNDVREIREFVGEHGAAIYKVLSWFWKPDRALYTTRIDVADVDRFAQNIEQAPGIYQPLVEKDYELRVTVVGDVAFTARINSQDFEGSRIDWRRNAFPLDYRADRLPPDVESALLEFHRKAGLVLGAYDLIVTPTGEHVFLEVNPAGQWLWIEDFTAFPITRCLASTLLGLPTNAHARDAQLTG